MNQRAIWSDPSIVAERRAPAEAFMGRELELPGKRYDAAERRIAAAHFAAVAIDDDTLELLEAKAAS